MLIVEFEQQEQQQQQLNVKTRATATMFKTRLRYQTESGTVGIVGWNENQKTKNTVFVL